MTFTEHLGELRNRLIKSVVAVIIGFAAAYSAHEHVFQAVARPILTALRNHGIPALQALQVTETITVYLQLSLIVGIFLASPYIIWQIWAFVAPGLLERERRVVVPIVGGIAAFFVLGVVFCYFVFLPMVADFLVGFTLKTGDISLIPTVQKTFGLTVIFLGVFGLAFQLPLLIFFPDPDGVGNPQKAIGFWQIFRCFGVYNWGNFDPTRSLVTNADGRAAGNPIPCGHCLFLGGRPDEDRPRCHQGKGNTCLGILSLCSCHWNLGLALAEGNGEAFDRFIVWSQNDLGGKT